MSNVHAAMPMLVLLPGMDGTGDLFEPLLAALGTSISTKVVRYPGDVPVNYEGLELYVRQALPNGGTYVLLGESFSGPLAIKVAASKPNGLVGLILCCTFVRNPRPALSFLKLFVDVLPLKSAPQRVFGSLLLGRYETPQLNSLVRTALSKVTHEVLGVRLASIASVDASVEASLVSVPVLELSALNDRIVPRGATEEIASLFPLSKRVMLSGPHCLLQACSLECATVVRDFLGDVSNKAL